MVPVGIKRPCLEQCWYEVLDQPNVEIVDVAKNEIKEFDETGVILEDGTHYGLDAVAIATGFVSLTFVFALQHAPY